MKKKLFSGILGLMLIGGLFLGLAGTATASSGNYTPMYEPCYDPRPRVILFCIPNGTQSCYTQWCNFFP